MRIENNESYRTGDINLFAACMSIGIPPQPGAAEVTSADDGHTYHSFRLSTVSECGQYRSVEMDKAWSNPRAFAREFPSHPFKLLMDFIQHAKRARKKDEWIEMAAEFIGVSRDAARKGLRDLDALEERAPDSPLTYVLCFIANRFAAIEWAKSAKPKELYQSGPAIVYVDSNLKKATKRELLARL